MQKFQLAHMRLHCPELCCTNLLWCRESLISQQLGGINAARAFDAAIHWNRTAESGDASGGSSGYTTVAGASAVSLADKPPNKPVNVTGWAEKLGLQNATQTGNGSVATAAGPPQPREKIWLYIGIFVRPPQCPSVRCSRKHESLHLTNICCKRTHSCSAIAPFVPKQGITADHATI